MKIGTSLGLIAVGLILAYAVDADIPVLDIRTLGSILFFVGLLGLAVTLYLEVAARRAPRPRGPRRAPAPEPRARRPEPFDPLAGSRDRSPAPRDAADQRTRVLRDPSDDRTRRL